MHKYSRDHGLSVVGASGSELGHPGRETLQNGKELGEVGMMEGGSRLRMSLRWRKASGWPGVGDALNWAMRVVNCLGETLGSLHTCHHPDEGKNLTTTLCFLKEIIGVV